MYLSLHPYPLLLSTLSLLLNPLNLSDYLPHLPLSLDSPLSLNRLLLPGRLYLLVDLTTSSINTDYLLPLLTDQPLQLIDILLLSTLGLIYQD